MSDTQQPGDAPASPLLLKQAREAAGLHVAALAAALKVPVRKLEHLEAGRYDQLPDMTFARALASSACRHLRIDPAPVLAQLPAAAKPALGLSGTALNAPFQGGADPVPFNPAGWLSRPAVLAAIALLLGALVIVFLPRADEPAAVWGEPGGNAVSSAPAPSPQTSGAEPAAAPIESAPGTGVSTTVAPAEPVALPSPTQASAVLAVPPATVVAVPAVPTASPAPIASPAPAAAESPSAPAAPASVMAVSARGETWIEVTTPAGETVVRRLLTAGESMEFNRAPPYSVVIGRADAARVTLRGQAFDLPPPSPNGVARFEVK